MNIRALWNEHLSLPAKAIALALVVGAVFILLAGYDLAKAYTALGKAAFLDYRYVADGLLKTTPLILAGAGVAFAFRANVFNIGAEGQFVVGALAATWLGTRLDWPALVLLPLILVAGFIGGGLWGVLPGWLKARLGVSEVITTIMMNYIALQFAGLMMTGPLQEAERIYPRSDPLVAGATMPVILPGTQLHLGFLIAVALAVTMYFVMFRTPLGYETRAVGLNPTAARANGIDVGRTILKTMVISGGLAGVAGAIELTGVTHQMFEHFASGQGYDAIAVALVAGNNPLGVVGSGWLFGVLRAGSNLMQRSAGVAWNFVYVFQALVIVFIAISAHLKFGDWRRGFRRGGAQDA